MNIRSGALNHFIQHTAEHRIRVITDNGFCRYLQFRNPRSIAYWFDIVTWPGNLCITGDMGTYVFRRLEDMFQFFRQPDVPGGVPEPYINPGYWGEKLLSIDRNSGYREFSEEQFSQRVNEHLQNFLEDADLAAEDAETLHRQVESEVLFFADQGEDEAYRAVYDFEFVCGDGKRFVFADFFDRGGTEEYTLHYLWNLYAIVWGIREYDNDLKWRKTFDRA